MNRKVAVLAAVALLTPVLDGAPAVGAVNSLATLAGVNQTLDGRSATIVVASGANVVHATHVVVGAETTSWKAAGKRTTVPTAEVLRIRTDRQGKFTRSFVTGLSIGAGSGLLLAREASSCTDWCIGVPTAAQAMAGSVVLGGAIGAIVGAFRHARPSEVVFEGPVDRYADRTTADRARTLDAASLRAHELAQRLGF